MRFAAPMAGIRPATRLLLVAVSATAIFAILVGSGSVFQAALFSPMSQRLVRALEASRTAQHRAVKIFPELKAEEEAIKKLAAELQTLGRAKRDARLTLADSFAVHTTLRRQLSRIEKVKPFLLSEKLSSVIEWFRAIVGWKMKERTIPAQELHAAADRSLKKIYVAREKHENFLVQYGSLLARYEEAQRNLKQKQAAARGAWGTVVYWEKELLRIQTELVTQQKLLHASAGTGAVTPPVENSRVRFLRENAAGREFSWPVSGKIGTKFKDPEYKKFFGFEHIGVDLLVKENSSVRASAKGIVFGVREGGPEGYTYVMIGHQGGVATVYGHLLSVSVQAGDWVSAQQEIGRSGGRPGTPGAGHVTTGAHLHFETIFLGKHVDPVNVMSE